MKLFTVKEAAELASQIKVKKVSIKTIYSWLARGIKGKRLASLKIGSAVMIPEHELEIFLKETCKSTQRVEGLAA